MRVAENFHDEHLAPPVTSPLPRTTARFIGVAQTSLASISEGGRVLVSGTLPRPASSVTVLKYILSSAPQISSSNANLVAAGLTRNLIVRSVSSSESVQLTHVAIQALDETFVQPPLL